MKKLVPDTLNAVIGSFELPSWRVAWERKRLIWQSMGPEYEVLVEEEIKPADEEWLAFWEELDQIQVWDWDSYYFNRSDGENSVISWGIQILLNDGRMIDSSGSNAVPGETRALAKRRRGKKEVPPAEETEPTFTNDGIPIDTFDRFVTALRHLVDNRAFGDPESVPETVATPGRSLTTAAPIKPVRKRRRRAKRTDSADASSSRGGKTRKSSSRRRGAARGKVESGEEAAPKSRRRRRRRKPDKSSAGEGGNAQAARPKKETAKSPDGSGRRRRRRGRRRKGPGGSAPEGKSS
ncbi:MAG TPA: hypothetical protein EYN79_09810 [Planctomycetes bacterium]|nr:hypothetical protein [Planctomycetota bacterium]